MSGHASGALATLVALSSITVNIALGTPPHWLPTNTRTLAIVNDYAAAWKIYRADEKTGWVRGRVEALSTKFGLTPHELAAHVAGPVSWAEMRLDNGRPAELLVAQIDDPTELLAAAGRRLAKRSARARAGGFKPAQSHVYSWTDNDGVDRVAVHAWHQGHLILTDNENAAQQVISLMVSQQPSGLTTQESFVAIWDQVGCSETADGVTLFWYAQPWLHEQQSPQAGGKAAPQDDNYLFAQHHGLTGIRAIGGRARVPANGDEQVEAVAYAPRPLQKSLKIFESFRNDASWRLPNWVTGATGNVVILHGDMPESLRHISLVFDDAFAQGVKGTYDEVLEDLKAEEGLGIDLVKDLYAFLGPRTYLVWGDRSGREFRPLMVAFETTDAEKVSSAIDGLMRDDPEAKPIRLENAAESLWYVAGEDGGEEFVMGVVQAFAVYSNDLQLVRQMTAASRGQSLKKDRPLTREVLPLLRNGSRPFLLLFRGPRRDDAQANGKQAIASSSTALDLLFQGPGRIWPTNREWKDLESLMRNLIPFEEQYRVVAGFVEAHGWRFSMHKRLPEPRKE